MQRRALWSATLGVWTVLGPTIPLAPYPAADLCDSALSITSTLSIFLLENKKGAKGISTVYNGWSAASLA